MSKVQEAYEIVSAIEQAKRDVANQFAEKIKALEAEVERLKNEVGQHRVGGD